MTFGPQQVLLSSSTHKMAEVIVSQSLGQTVGQMRGVVSPFVMRVGQTLVEMIESMHTEDYSRSIARGRGWWVWLSYLGSYSRSVTSMCEYMSWWYSGCGTWVCGMK